MEITFKTISIENITVKKISNIDSACLKFELGSYNGLSNAKMIELIKIKTKIIVSQALWLMILLASLRILESLWKIKRDDYDKYKYILLKIDNYSSSSFNLN